MAIGGTAGSGATYYHQQTAATVKRLLAGIPDTHSLVPNDVMNLAIIDEDEDDVGYVDLGFARVVMYADEETEETGG